MAKLQDATQCDLEMGPLGRSIERRGWSSLGMRGGRNRGEPAGKRSVVVDVKLEKVEQGIIQLRQSARDICLGTEDEFQGPSRLVALRKRNVL